MRYLPGGTIVLRANAGSASRVRWFVNGRSASAGPAVPFPLRAGRYAIEARAEHERAVVHVVVAADTGVRARSAFTVTR